MPQTEANTESLQSTNETKISLKRVLGLGTAILLVAGNMIGTGVFKKIVPMAQTGLSENAILAAWLVAGFITLMGAFVVAGLATMTTESGGMYEYIRIIFGNFLAYLWGWTLFIIAASGSIAAIAFIFAQSVNAIGPLHDPLFFLRDFSIAHFIFPFASSGIKILAIATILVLTWVNYRGVKNGAVLNNLLTGAKILGILLLIIFGLFVINVPAVQPMKAVSSPSGFSAFFAAMLAAFWAYEGFANVGYVAGEIKSPKRNIPVAVIAGVALVTVLYLLINFAFIKSLSLPELALLQDNSIAGTVMAGKVLGKPGMLFVSILIMISSLGTLNVMILFYSRLYMRMAQENVFFKSAARIHHVYRTPYIALIFSLLWSIVLTISGTFDTLTDMTVFSGFLFFAILSYGLIRMKQKGFIKEKIPGYPVAPALFILFTVILLVTIFIAQPKLSIIGGLLMLSGIPFYYLFKKQRA